MKRINHLVLEIIESNRIFAESTNFTQSRGVIVNISQAHLADAYCVNSSTERDNACWDLSNSVATAAGENFELTIWKEIYRLSGAQLTNSSARVQYLLNNSSTILALFQPAFEDLRQKLQATLKDGGDKASEQICQLRRSSSKITQLLANLVAGRHRPYEFVWAKLPVSSVWKILIVVTCASVLTVLALLSALICAHFPSTKSLQPHRHTITTLRCGVGVMTALIVAMFMIASLALAALAGVQTVLCPCTADRHTHHTLSHSNRISCGASPTGNTSHHQRVHLSQLIGGCQSSVVTQLDQLTSATVAQLLLAADTTAKHIATHLSLAKIPPRSTNQTEFATLVRSQVQSARQVTSFDLVRLLNKNQDTVDSNQQFQRKPSLIKQLNHIIDWTETIETFMQQNVSHSLSQAVSALEINLLSMLGAQRQTIVTAARDNCSQDDIYRAFQFIELSTCHHLPAAISQLWLSLTALGLTKLLALLVAHCLTHLLVDHQHYLILVPVSIVRPRLWQHLSELTPRCSVITEGVTEEFIQISP